MGLLDFLFGKKESFEQQPTITPEQRKLLDQLLGGLGGLGPDAFGALGQMLSGGEAPWEAAAKRQFGEEIVPGIAERFSSMGEGGQQSSAFQQALGKAGESLAERLAAMRAQERQAGLGLYGQLFGQGLGARPFETTYRPGSPGFFQGVAPYLGMGLGGTVGRLLGGGF